MTGKTKSWLVNSPISPDIVRWPAVISSPASFLEMVEKIVGIFQAMCENAFLLDLGLGRRIELLCGVQAIWFAL